MDGGNRPVSVYSRRDESEAEWSLHAEGTLAVPAAAASEDLTVSPRPPGAESVDMSRGYERLAARGYDYGPAFQGLVAVWRRGPELFAEVAAPGEAGVQVDTMGIHPAVLDAVLHAGGLAVDTAQTMLPFCWRGVSLYAGGAGRVRARITPTGDDAVSIAVADTAGLPSADGALADHPPDHRRAITHRVDRGYRRSRSRSAGSRVGTNKLRPQHCWAAQSTLGAVVGGLLHW